MAVADNYTSLLSVIFLAIAGANMDVRSRGCYQPYDAAVEAATFVDISTRSVAGSD